MKHPVRILLCAVLMLFVIGVLFQPVGRAQQPAIHRADALVLVNSASSRFLDFQYYVQPYLDNFGIPYSIVDVSQGAVPSDVGNYAVIIVGHRQLDTPVFLSDGEQTSITEAVRAGTGLVNFDNDLWTTGGVARYTFIKDILGFGYTPNTSGNGVTFSSVAGGAGYQINCWEDANQQPVLPTISNSALLNPGDNKWDEFLYASRGYPGVFAGYGEAPPVMRFHGDVPDGTYTMVAHLYWSDSFRYYWGDTPEAPKAHSIDVTSGVAGDFSDYTLGTVTVTGGHFSIYVQNADDLTSAPVNPYWGWAWIRLVPAGQSASAMHYVTARHGSGDSISTGGMTMAGITLPTGVTALATTGTQPFLAVTTANQGRAVQWGSYDWMSSSVKGPVYGLDDLVWRSIVWAARKPFVMQALPPFLTMRVDDVSEPHQWIDIANEFGIKPWLGLFTDDIDNVEAARVSALTLAGNATASIHAFGSNRFFYRNRPGNVDFDANQLDANFLTGLQWHQQRNIPIAKYVVAHYAEVSVGAVPRLNAWGVEFIGTMPELGTGWGAPWAIGGPYRQNPPTPPGASSDGRPFYYADYLKVPDVPDSKALFNCVSEVRDNAGYEWYPSSTDIPGTIDRGTKQLKRGFDSLVLPTLFTHEYFLPSFSDANWRAVLQNIADNIASYRPIPVTMDYACQYARAIHESGISASTYNTETRQLTTVLSGQTDMPTKFYLFVEDAGEIRDMLVDVPTFSGSAQVNFTPPGQLHHIVVTPSSATLATGGSRQFLAQGLDAGNNPIPDLAFTWSVVNGGGTVSNQGLFVAGALAGSYANTVQASFAGVVGMATVNVVAPALDHFTFEAIPSPQFPGSPFAVTISARDVSGSLLTAFIGQATLAVSTGTIAPTSTGNFSGGQWTGMVTLGEAAQGLSITATAGAASGTSAPIEVQPEPMFYRVSAPLSSYHAGESFPVTVSAYTGITINCWEDSNQEPVMMTTEDVPSLLANYAAGRWTEFLYRPSRTYPTISASVLSTATMPTMRFFANGIPNGQYQVIANLYDNGSMRYFFGYASDAPAAYSVDTAGGATGSEHREYSLGTVNITNNAFNLYTNKAQRINPLGAEGYGWAWIRLVPVQREEVRINLWENEHQVPVLDTTASLTTLSANSAAKLWTEFLYADTRPFPLIAASASHVPVSPTMHFLSTGITNGQYEVIANLYDNGSLRYFYGYTSDTAQARSVDTAGGAPGTQCREYSLGTVDITGGAFDLYVNRAQLLSGTYDGFGWSWIRLVPVGPAGSVDVTMTSSSPTVLFDANANGTFGEGGDSVKTLVNGTMTMAAMDGSEGTSVTITATDDLGRSGSSTFTILAREKAPQTITFGALGAKTYGDPAFAVTATASSGLAVSFAASGACTVAGETVTLTGAGDCTITASQAGDASYMEAPPVAQAFAVAKAASTTTITGAGTFVYDGTGHSLSAMVTGAGGLSAVVAVTGCVAAPTNVAESCTATATYGGDANCEGSSDSQPVVITRAPATLTLSYLSQTYDGSAKAATVTTTPAGLTTSVTYAGSATPPTNAGSYAVVATVTDSNYDATASDTLVIGKATTTLTLSNLSHTYDGTVKAAVVTTDPSGLSGVSITYDGAMAAPTAAGTYAVAATLTHANYTAAPISGTLVIAQAAATLTLSSLSHTYDGTAKVAIVTTDPSGLSGVSITYDGGATAPTAAGTYAVGAMLTHDNYTAAPISGTLVVTKASAIVALSGLTATYDGSPKAATVTTTPAGLTTSVTYGGSPTPPTNAGSYAVVVTITAANYTGTVNGTLTIQKATQTIAFGALGAKTYGDPPFTVSAIASSGLPATFVALGACTVAGSTVTLTGVGDCTITATQAGNTNYLAASPIPQTMSVLGPKDLKLSVLAQLSAERGTFNKGDAKKLDNAIKHLTRSVDPELWLDPLHLDPKHGNRVFQAEHEAVKQLQELLKNRSRIPTATIHGFIDSLVGADRLLARIAVTEATAVGGSERKLTRELDKCLQEMKKAESRVRAGDDDNAIDYFRKAWEHAQHALKMAPCTDPE